MRCVFCGHETGSSSESRTGWRSCACGVSAQASEVGGDFGSPVWRNADTMEISISYLPKERQHWVHVPLGTMLVAGDL